MGGIVRVGEILLLRGESGKDLEREAHAMMRDPKQTGQSQPRVLPKKVTLPSQESHPCRRTVIVGLVGLLLSGCGITWLTSACRSRSQPTLLFTYEGHSDWVNAVAWSPDGQRIASGSFDWTVQVWNATDGGQVSTYQGHPDWVLAVAWSPDGKRIASASYDGTVQVWNATDGGQVYTYQGHSEYIIG